MCHALFLLRCTLSACITSLHMAFLPVDSHLPPHFLWDSGHLQTASVCGLLPWGKSPLPETIKGLKERSAQSAERRPRRGPAEGEWRPQYTAGSGERLQWIYMICSFLLMSTFGISCLTWPHLFFKNTFCFVKNVFYPAHISPCCSTTCTTAEGSTFQRKMMTLIRKNTEHTSVYDHTLINNAFYEDSQFGLYTLQMHKTL